MAPAVSARTIGNCLFEAGLKSCVPLARLPMKPRHAKRGYSSVVKESTGERNGALLSLEIRVGSDCKYWMHTCMA